MKYKHLFLFAVYFVLFYFPIFSLFMRFRYGILTMVILLLLVIIRNKVYIRITKYNICLIVISLSCLFFLMLPNSRIDISETVSLIVSYVVCSAYSLFICADEKEISIALKTIVYMSVLFSVFILFCSLNKQFYSDNILPLFSKTVQIELDAGIDSGYGVSLAGTPSYANYFFSLSSIIVFGSIDYSLASKKTNSILLLLLFFVSILIGGRRTELVSHIITLVVLYIITNKDDLNTKIRKTVLTIFVVFIAAVSISYLLKIGKLSRFIDTFTDLLNGNIGGSNFNDVSTGRIYLWDIALGLFKKNPVFGIGWAKFANYSPSKRVTNVHNLLIQLLCETGIVGTLLILIPLITSFIRSYKIVKIVVTNKKNVTKLVYISSLTSFSIQLYMLIANLFDPCFYKFFTGFIYLIVVVLSDYSNRYLTSYEKGL